MDGVLIMADKWKTVMLGMGVRSDLGLLSAKVVLLMFV